MTKVLVVEDNELNLKLFQDLLLMQEYEVITSRDGLGILDIIQREKPQLILMDIQLRELSGLELIKQIKATSFAQNIPIIAITAFAMKHDESIISASGCDLYLSKPVSIKNFFEAVNQFTESRNID